MDILVAEGYDWCWMPHPSTTAQWKAKVPPAIFREMAQIRTLPDDYRDALVIVMGDDSKQSRRSAQYLEWAFESLVIAFADGRGNLTEEVIRGLLPAETLRLAIDVAWIPYLDDNGEPLPEKTGEMDVHGYPVTEAFHSAFLRLLPIETYVTYAKQSWDHPTPAEIVEEVLAELSWLKLKLVEQMQIENGTQYVPDIFVHKGEKNVSRRLVPPQNAKERHGLDQLLTPPLPNARRNTAQADHRTTLLKVIRKHSKRYAELQEKQLRWRRP